jgi:hypothetical protein
MEMLSNNVKRIFMVDPLILFSGPARSFTLPPRGYASSKPPRRKLLANETEKARCKPGDIMMARKVDTFCHH